MLSNVDAVVKKKILAVNAGLLLRKHVTAANHQIQQLVWIQFVQDAK